MSTLEVPLSMLDRESRLSDVVIRDVDGFTFDAFSVGFRIVALFR
jgi:hypothetical protein